MIDKYKSLDPQTRKTVSLAATLLIVIVLSLVALYYMSVSGSSGGETQQPASQVQQIENTQFNQAGLDYVDETSTDRPSLDGSLGKPNPFADYE